MIFYGKTFAEKRLEAKGRKYDRAMRKAMKWETQAGMPTRGLLDAQISEKLRELEELFAMRGHLEADNNETMSHGWLGMSQLMAEIRNNFTKMATKGLN